jgi:hypothetical protein
MSNLQIGQLNTLHSTNTSTFWGRNWILGLDNNPAKIDGARGAAAISISDDGTLKFNSQVGGEGLDQPAAIAPKLQISPNGNVGIGTDITSSKLTILGNRAANKGDAYLSLISPIEDGKGILFGDEAQPGWKWRIEKPANSKDLVIGDGSLENSIRIVKDPNIIGETTPPRVVIGLQTIKSENLTQFNGLPVKFSVDGVGAFKEIAVLEPLQWADYVFDKDYKLITLDSVKTFVDQNHHLPNVPSAEEVSKNGIMLGEMNAILLRKIEELTLYVIDLKKELETIKTKK